MKGIVLVGGIWSRLYPYKIVIEHLSCRGRKKEKKYVMFIWNVTIETSAAICRNA